MSKLSAFQGVPLPKDWPEYVNADEEDVSGECQEDS